MLDTLPYPPQDRPTLEAMHYSDLLILFINWRSRYVTPRPRTVHRSIVLEANPLSSDPIYTPGLARITHLIETGGDLKPHLSRGVQYGYRGTGPPKESHLDMMLNDWGIHHLHLNTELDTDGFVKRPKTEPQWNRLLFAAFTPDGCIPHRHHGAPRYW